MNKLTIIGNLTRDPELRSTQSNVNVCSFSVAVNRRKRGNENQEADYFNVSAWRERGEVCAKYLKKGSKVCVIGAVSVRTFTRNDGTSGASLEVTADEVEFLSSRNDNSTASESSEYVPAEQEPQRRDEQTGFEQVDTDELPF